VIAVPASIGPVHPHARDLIQLVAELKVPFGHERSFRFVRGGVLSDRFLLSVAKTALGARGDALVLELLSRLKVPPDFLETISRLLPPSPFVHFGFERDFHGAVYKLYLEQPAAGGSRGPVLLHQAFKWDVNDAARRVISRYVWHPALTVEQMIVRVADIYGGEDLEPCRTTLEILQLAQRRMVRGGIRYLEVTDEGTSRRSFDLNLYDANIRIVDVEPLLAQVRRHYSVDPSVFESLWDPIRALKLGHIAGGLHRDGRSFFTVYFGVQGRHG
jgi:tryptophan halogenase